MITRKENLLVRPFQRRKYIEHRQKVITALPRIDDITPPKRNHVYIKCKKLQTEVERHAQIERDNFILLRHLSDIMNMKRVDNYWLYEHPKFLHRIKLFKHHSAKTSFKNDTETNKSIRNVSKKERCIACHPENYVKKEAIPEERVPWEMKSVREYHSDHLTKKHVNKKTLLNEQSRLIFNRDSLKAGNSNTITLNETKLSFPINENPVKYRSSTVPSRGRTSRKLSSSRTIKEKLPNEQPLTVVIKFPPKAQVTLNAGIDGEIT